MQLSAQVQVQFTSKENKSEASIGWWEQESGYRRQETALWQTFWIRISSCFCPDKLFDGFNLPTDTRRTYGIQAQLLAYDNETILIFNFLEI